MKESSSIVEHISSFRHWEMALGVSSIWLATANPARMSGSFATPEMVFPAMSATQRTKAPSRAGRMS